MCIAETLEMDDMLESDIVEGRLADVDRQIDKSIGSRMVSSSTIEGWIVQDEVPTSEMALMEDPPMLKSTTE